VNVGFGTRKDGDPFHVFRKTFTPVPIACALVGLAAVATLVTLALVGTNPPNQAAAAAQLSCAKAVVHDWSDGRIDRDYSVGCYRAALRSLPVDLRVYSSAPDDIRQALSIRIVQGSQKISGHQGATSVRKIESARSTAP
jgi:hypothetical protein